MIRRGESRADQRDFAEDRAENVKSGSSSNPEMSVFESTLMSSEEDLIKASVTKMVLEDDLTSAASHFCLPLYFCQSPFTCLSPPPSLPLVCVAGQMLWISMRQPHRCITNTSERWLKMTHLSLAPFFSVLLSLSQEIAAYLITFEKHEEWLTTSPKTR